MKKWKEKLMSEKGMRTVNGLFCLSVFFQGSWVTVAACLLWMAYLALCVKYGENKSLRGVYAGLMVVAAALAGYSAYTLIAG